MSQTTSRTTRDYAVSGMTCGHCVMSVREEVSEVGGVQAAVADAGYEVV